MFSYIDNVRLVSEDGEVVPRPVPAIPTLGEWALLVLALALAALGVLTLGRARI